MNGANRFGNEHLEVCSGLIFKEFDKSFSIIPAQREFGPVAQDHCIIAAEHRVKLFDPVDVNNRRPVYAEESVRIELCFDAVHRFAYHVSLAADVKLYIISGSLYPVDLVRLEEKHAAGSLYDEAFEIFLFRLQIGDKRRQSLVDPAESFSIDLFTGAHNGAMQAFASEWLQ